MTLEAEVAEARARRLKGSVAVVTGATGGVGRGITRRLAVAGVEVVACSRDANRASALADDLDAEGLRIVPAQLDVTDPADFERLVTRTVERFGRLDLLVNNAAVMHVEPVLEMSLDDWARVLQVNVGGVLAGDQISVTTLYPGNVWEGMQSQLHHLAGDPPGEPSGPSARAKLDSWPTGRWQRPDDTGDVAVFIAAFVGMGLNGELIVGHPHRHRL